MEIFFIILAISLVAIFAGTCIYKAVAAKKGKGGCGCGGGCSSCPYCCNAKKDENKKED